MRVVAAFIFGLFACFVLLLIALAARAEAASSIVVILADDMRVDDVPHLPTLQQLAAQGTSFDMALAPFALCAPARTSLLTGWSPRHHGVYENNASLFDPTWPTLGTRLKAAGYRTAIIGKLLNQLRRVDWQLPGWDTYQVLEKHSDFGVEQSHVLADRAIAFLTKAKRDGVSAFLYLAPVSPHGPNMGPPECTGPWPTAPVEANQHVWTRRMSSLCGLDELVGKVAAAVPPDTVFIFLSDQGFELGENGRTGKSQLVIDALQFPLLIWGPGIGHTERREIVSTMDVTATVLELAGANGGNIDGHSLVPLLVNDTARWGGSLLLEGR